MDAIKIIMAGTRIACADLLHCLYIYGFHIIKCSYLVCHKLSNIIYDGLVTTFTYFKALLHVTKSLYWSRRFENTLFLSLVTHYNES